jgi:hypothetical protein
MIIVDSYTKRLLAKQWAIRRMMDDRSICVRAVI